MRRDMVPMRSRALWLCFCVFSCILPAVYRAASPGKAHYLTRYPSALCLDGSPGLYYVRPGHGDGATKFLIYHEGGGFCGSHADCAERAKGHLGSTSRDDGSRSFDDVAFFSTSEKENPLMWNWNHVFVRYCDGAYFSGERPDAVHVGKASLHYKGRWITEALFDDLYHRWELVSATDVVFSGCSAGAIRVFAHLDALNDRLPNHTRVTGLADSGFYLDVPMFTSLKQFVAKEQKGIALLNSKCVKDHVGAEEKCLVGSVVTKYLKTPIFAWQSRYDTDQLVCEMDTGCAESEQCVREYGDNLTAQLHRSLLAVPQSGAFLDSCSRHCEGPRLPLDDVMGRTPLQAMAAWYIGLGDNFYRQATSYPCHDCCGTAYEKTDLSLEPAEFDILQTPLWCAGLLCLGCLAYRKSGSTRCCRRWHAII